MNCHTQLIRFSHTQWCDRAITPAQLDVAAVVFCVETNLRINPTDPT